MQRILFTFEIYAGTEAEYKRRHDEIWPELVQVLQEAGIKNYTLFRRGTRVMAYAECDPDAETAFGKVGATDVNRRWSEWFKDTIVTLADDEGKLFQADEVWHLD